MATRLLSPDADGLAEAAAILRGGGLVAMPTETVYGLAARADDPGAVARIFAAKGRPAANPLIVHVRGAVEAERLAALPPGAEGLMAEFWPGPLTLVLPLRPGAAVAPAALASLPTIALRAPAHPVARALVAAAGPLAAPSANLSGRVSPTTAAHVVAGLGGRIDAVVDGGRCALGLESTILALAPGEPPRLLREGAVPAEAIEARLGPLTRELTPGRPAAPGQLASHYAPRAALRLEAVSAGSGETLLGFGPVAGDLTLSDAGDLAEAAANLFAHLHELDRRGAARIAVAPIPEEGLGRAINDRLRRAAAPRDRGG